MKLEEIYTTGTQTRSVIDPTKFDMNNAEVVALAEAPFKIVKAFTTLDSSVVLYGVISDDGALICSTVGRLATVFGKQYFIIGGTWTAETHRRKGIATMLYTTLVKRLKLRLMSDREQSPEMFQVWNKLRSQHLASVISTHTGDVVDVSDNQLFQDTDSLEDNFRFVMESPHTGIPDVGTGVIYEHQIYTYPSKQGMYE